MTRLRVRISRIPGVTPKNMLARPLVFGAVLGDFEFMDSADWRDYTTVTHGQRSQPGGGKGQHGRNLRTLNLEVLTQLGDPLPYEADRGASGARTRRELARILRSRAAFRFVATMHQSFGHGGAELRMNASVRSMTRTTRHGEPDTRYLSLEITEVRSAEVERRTRHGGDKLPTKHKIEKGDTLRALAKHYYKGRGQFWKAIKQANGDGRGVLKGYGPDEKLDKLIKGKQDKLKIPEAKLGWIEIGGKGLGDVGGHKVGEVHEGAEGLGT